MPGAGLVSLEEQVLVMDEYLVEDSKMLELERLPVATVCDCTGKRLCTRGLEARTFGDVILYTDGVAAGPTIR